MSNMKTHSRFTKINSYDVTHQSTTHVERTQHFYGFHSSVNQNFYATLSDVAVSVYIYMIPEYHQEYAKTNLLYLLSVLSLFHQRKDKGESCEQGTL